MICLVRERGPPPVRVRPDDRERIIRDCLPPALVDCLLAPALEPVLDAAARRGVRALLAVTVCDPACGSGSLLVAAARRIARRGAEGRGGDLSPGALRRGVGGGGG